MQLSLFENKEIHPVDQLLTEKANVLLQALNDRRKTKEMYLPQYYFKHLDMVVLIASDKNKNTLFNIIDMEGKTPSGFSACWRSANHIKQELGL